MSEFPGIFATGRTRACTLTFRGHQRFSVPVKCQRAMIGWSQEHRQAIWGFPGRAEQGWFSTWTSWFSSKAWLAQPPRVLNTGHHRNEQEREWSSYQIVSLIFSNRLHSLPFDDHSLSILACNGMSSGRTLSASIWWWSYVPVGNSLNASWLSPKLDPKIARVFQWSGDTSMGRNHGILVNEEVNPDSARHIHVWNLFKPRKSIILLYYPIGWVWKSGNGVYITSPKRHLQRANDDKPLDLFGPTFKLTQI